MNSQCSVNPTPNATTASNASSTSRIIRSSSIAVSGLTPERPYRLRAKRCKFHRPPRRGPALAGPRSPVRFAAFRTTKEGGVAVDVQSEKLTQLVDENVEVEQLGSGFTFTEGPIWNPEGFLLFSDMPADTRRRWDEQG